MQRCLPTVVAGDVIIYICKPTLGIDSDDSDSNQDSESRTGPDCPILESTTLVSNPTDIVGGQALAPPMSQSNTHRIEELSSPSEGR